MKRNLRSIKEKKFRRAWNEYNEDSGEEYTFTEKYKKYYLKPSEYCPKNKRAIMAEIGLFIENSVNTVHSGECWYYEEYYEHKVGKTLDIFYHQRGHKPYVAHLNDKYLDYFNIGVGFYDEYYYPNFPLHWLIWTVEDVTETYTITLSGNDTGGLQKIGHKYDKQMVRYFNKRGSRSRLGSSGKFRKKQRVKKQRYLPIDTSEWNVI